MLKFFRSFRQVICSHVSDSFGFTYKTFDLNQNSEDDSTHQYGDNRGKQNPNTRPHSPLGKPLSGEEGRPCT